jgi:hypothetical protein
MNMRCFSVAPPIIFSNPETRFFTHASFLPACQALLTDPILITHRHSACHKRRFALF